MGKTFAIVTSLRYEGKGVVTSSPFLPPLPVEDTSVAAVNRALAPHHLRVGSRFRQRRGAAARSAVIAGSKIPAYRAWLEVLLLEEENPSAQ